MIGIVGLGATCGRLDSLVLMLLRVDRFGLGWPVTRARFLAHFQLERSPKTKLRSFGRYEWKLNSPRWEFDFATQLMVQEPIVAILEHFPLKHLQRSQS
jgi:hypothetical protein